MPALAERHEVEPGKVLHCDLKGPLDVAFNKKVFVLVVVDEGTRLTSTQAIRSKSDVPRALESVSADLARHPILKQIKIGEHTTVHTDSEVVLQSAALAKALATRRVSLRASPPYAHERNGIAERAVQTIFNFDVTRSLLQQADMPNNMWPVALHHATYLRNNAPSQALGGRSPMQMLGAQATQVSALYTFGVKVFVKIDNASRTALQP